MDRTPQLIEILRGLEGVEDVYTQAPTKMVYPCIKLDFAPNRVSFADNVKYRFKTGYDLILIDRRANSLIRPQVEALQYTEFQRSYAVEGLNHFVFQMFF